MSLLTPQWMCQCNVILICTLPPALLQEISTFQRLLYTRAAKVRKTLAPVFLPGNVFQEWRTTVTKPKRSSQMCSHCSRTDKKSKVRNLKRVCVRGEGFCSLSLSSEAPLSSFHGVYAVWPLGKEGDPSLTYRPDTHWQTTNPWKGQGRRGREHLLLNRTNTSLSARRSCGGMDRVIVDGQERRRRAKQSCCQSKEVESSSSEGKHGDGNSFTGPAGDKTGWVIGVNWVCQDLVCFQ